LTRAPTRTELALWLALFAGFSPVLTAFARHEAWYAPPSTLVAPVLIAVALARGIGVRDEPRRWDAALIAAGLAFELIGIALRTWTVAWLGFPIAVLGMALWLGVPSWRIAALAFGLVPIPEGIRGAFTPAAESALLSGACAAWRTLGVDFSCTGPVARLGARHLELVHDDVGWALAPLLAQLGWFVAVCAKASTARALRQALVFAVGTIAIQPLAVAVALGLLALGSGSVAHAFLSAGLWLGCTAVALLWSRR
jgi:hypothetical protein